MINYNNKQVDDLSSNGLTLNYCNLLLLLLVTCMTITHANLAL